MTLSDVIYSCTDWNVNFHGQTFFGFFNVGVFLFSFIFYFLVQSNLSFNLTNSYNPSHSNLSYIFFFNPSFYTFFFSFIDFYSIRPNPSFDLTNSFNLINPNLTHFSLIQTQPDFSLSLKKKRFELNSDWRTWVINRVGLDWRLMLKITINLIQVAWVACVSIMKHGSCRFTGPGVKLWLLQMVFISYHMKRFLWNIGLHLYGMGCMEIAVGSISFFFSF